MQSDLLEAHPERPLSVYVVWSNQLPSDSRGGWDPGLLDDPRVTEYWDGQGVAARWLFENREAIGFEYFGGAAVWDSSLLFGPDATWDSVPRPIEHLGYTVNRRRADLERHLSNIWDRAAA